MAPPAAQGLYQEHRRGEALALHLHGLPLIAEQSLLCRDHFEIRVHAASISGGGYIERVLGAFYAGIGLGDCAIERGQARNAVLHFFHGRQHRLPVGRYGGGVVCIRNAHVRPGFPGVEQGLRGGEPERP